MHHPQLASFVEAWQSNDEQTHLQTHTQSEVAFCHHDYFEVNIDGVLGSAIGQDDVSD